jgi:hypothetical protein
VVRYFPKLALAINIALAVCFHGYTVYYVYGHHGQGWAVVALLLPGVSELALCFVSVYTHDAVFNYYTIPFFCYMIAAFAVRFMLDDLYVSMRNKPATVEVLDSENAQVMEAVQAAERGEYKQACRTFLAVLRHNPDNGTACFGVGTSLLMLGKQRLGLQFVEKAAFLGCAEARVYLAGLKAPR